MNQKMLILALETSGRIGSVALGLSEIMLEEHTFSAPLAHSEEILPAIKNLIKKYAQKPEKIKNICLAIGPGSFTGLRIAVTIAKTMNLAINARLTTVDTLDVIAENFRSFLMDNNSGKRVADRRKKLNAIPLPLNAKRIAVILDAKRAKFYIAVYQRTKITSPKPDSAPQWEKILPDSLMTAETFIKKFANPQEPIWLLGEGLGYYKEKFNVPGLKILEQKYWSPSAGNVYKLGWEKIKKGLFADPLTLTPKYLRKPDAKIKQT